MAEAPPPDETVTDGGGAPQRQRDQPGRNYPFGGYGRPPFRQIFCRCEVPAVTSCSHPGQHQRLRPQAVRRAGSSVRLIA